MIADDQTVVREGLRMVLDVIPELEVVAAVADGEQALAAVAEHQPDAILLDLHMPVLDGVGATERLTREHPEVAIVVLTTYADDETIIAALKAGARGYLTKNADRREISQALHSAAAGHTILPPEVTAMLLAGGPSAQRARPPLADELPDDLTPREAEVLKLLAAGLSNGEIAARADHQRAHGQDPHQPRVREDRLAGPRPSDPLRARAPAHLVPQRQACRRAAMCRSTTSGRSSSRATVAGDRCMPANVAAAMARIGAELPRLRIVMSARKLVSASSGTTATPAPAATKPWTMLKSSLRNATRGSSPSGSGPGSR